MWSQDKLAKVETSYRQHLQEQRIMLYDGKLIILKPISQNVYFISLISVPTPLRRKISYYHTSPTGCHMGEYKTLFCLCLLFLARFMKGCQRMG